jgi:hypothetical protein
MHVCRISWNVKRLFIWWPISSNIHAVYDLKCSWWYTAMSSQAVSHVSVELVSSALETVPVSIRGGEVMGAMFHAGCTVVSCYSTYCQRNPGHSQNVSGMGHQCRAPPTVSTNVYARAPVSWLCINTVCEWWNSSHQNRQSLKHQTLSSH